MSIFGCVTGSRYTMTATLFTEQFSQDPDTGEFERGYVRGSVMKCYAAGIAASGKDTPGTYENFSGMGVYSSTDFVRVYSPSQIPKDAKVSFITDSLGKVFSEDDGAPTIYDSNGSTPIVSATGRIMEYVSMLSRSEVQDVTIF